MLRGTFILLCGSDEETNIVILNIMLTPPKGLVLVKILVLVSGTGVGVKAGIRLL